MMSKVELDICHEDHTLTVRSIEDKYGIKGTLLKEIGPAGGNPLYLFEGPRTSLEDFLLDYSQGIDVDFWFSRIQ
jgi:hypothetical protein